MLLFSFGSKRIYLRFKRDDLRMQRNFRIISTFARVNPISFVENDISPEPCMLSHVWRIRHPYDKLAPKSLPVFE
jgi:hypothetical protein